MQRDGLRRQGDDRFKRGPCAIEKGFRIAMRYEPGVEIRGAARIDSFQGLERGIALVEFHGAIGMERGEAVSNGAAGVLGKNDPKARNGAAMIRLARAH